MHFLVFIQVTTIKAVRRVWCCATQCDSGLSKVKLWRRRDSANTTRDLLTTVSATAESQSRRVCTPLEDRGKGCVVLSYFIFNACKFVYIHMGRSYNNFQSQFSPSTMQFLGTKCRSSGLVANTFTCLNHPVGLIQFKSVWKLVMN